MRNYISICLFFLLLSNLSFAQSETSKKIVGYIKSINLFNQLNPQEKVYLHFDNTGYYLGETIWFKAYIVNATGHQLHPLSKVLHVELLTPQGEVIDSRQLRIENGQCHGEFKLSTDYRSGFYEVRAYTRVMLNFGDDCVFSRVFPVFEDPDTPGDYAELTLKKAFMEKNHRKESEDLAKVNVTFYPEGGHAVLGLPSRIAFKATDSKGEDIHVKGTIYSKTDEAVVSFETIHQGMGFFYFTPQTDTYKVVVEHQDKTHSFQLSDFLSQGYLMQVEHLDEENIQVQLQKSLCLPADTIAVSVSCRGKIYQVETVRLGEEAYRFQVPKSKLPAGCLQFTLFDAGGKILAERLAFNHRVHYNSIRVKADKESYKPFEKVNMEFSVTDDEGAPVETTFSLAIRDASTSPQTAYQDNVLTNLLLSSDIKGYIENPMQYFKNDDRLTRVKLDLLMMIQGWRRYDWQVMAGVIPFEVKHFVEEGLSISGRVLDLTSNKARGDADILFWMKQKDAYYHNKGKTDKDGKFHFFFPNDSVIKNKWILGLQVTEKGKRKHSRFLLDRWFSPQGKAYTYFDTNLEEEILPKYEYPEDSLKKPSINEMQLLSDVVIKRKKKEKIKPMYVFDVEKEMNRLLDEGGYYPVNYKEYLIHRVSALTLDDDMLKYGNSMTYTCYSCNDTLTPNRIEIGGINMEDIYSIKVYPIGFAWLSVTKDNCECRKRSPNSPMLFVMVKLYDDGLHDEYKKGIRYTYFNGYSVSKKFYHPNNRDKILGDADFRRTLYWNPNVKMNNDGVAAVSFYNNSSCKKMEISAEGVTEGGTALVLEQ